jgi:hypothetical protein
MPAGDDGADDLRTMSADGPRQLAVSRDSLTASRRIPVERLPIAGAVIPAAR